MVFIWGGSVDRMFFVHLTYVRASVYPSSGHMGDKVDACLLVIFSIVLLFFISLRTLSRVGMSFADLRSCRICSVVAPIVCQPGLSWVCEASARV